MLLVLFYVFYFELETKKKLDKILLTLATRYSISLIVIKRGEKIKRGDMAIEVGLLVDDGDYG